MFNHVTTIIKNNIKPFIFLFTIIVFFLFFFFLPILFREGFFRQRFRIWVIGGIVRFEAPGTQQIFEAMYVWTFTDVKATPKACFDKMLIKLLIHLYHGLRVKLTLNNKYSEYIKPWGKVDHQTIMFFFSIGQVNYTTSSLERWILTFWRRVLLVRRLLARETPKECSKYAFTVVPV